MIKPAKRLVSKELIRQIFFFGVIGVIATLTHYFAALASSHLVPLYLANLLGYLCAVSVSYFGHGRVTFRAELTQNLFKKFAFVSFLTFLSSEVLLFVLTHSMQQPKEIAFAVVALTIPVISFIINKFWVFTHNHNTI